MFGIHSKNLLIASLYTLYDTKVRYYTFTLSLCTDTDFDDDVLTTVSKQYTLYTHVQDLCT